MLPRKWQRIWRLPICHHWTSSRWARANVSFLDRGRARQVHECQSTREQLHGSCHPSQRQSHGVRDCRHAGRRSLYTDPFAAGLGRICTSGNYVETEGKQNAGRSSSFSLVDFEDERYCFIGVSVSGEFNWTVPRFYCSRVISPVFRLCSDL
jgi:hypothetical protein